MEHIAVVRHNFVTSHLRTQLYKLRSILDSVESGNKNERYDNVCYDIESLRQIELNIRQIRKLFSVN